MEIKEVFKDVFEHIVKECESCGSKWAVEEVDDKLLCEKCLKRYERRLKWKHKKEGSQKQT